jgi:hypothetical protein
MTVSWACDIWEKNSDSSRVGPQAAIAYPIPFLYLGGRADVIRSCNLGLRSDRSRLGVV